MKPLLVLAALIVLYSAKSCHQKDREIRRLDRLVQEFPSEKEEVWMDSCMRSVLTSCYYADCAIVSIEEMQHKICRLPEEL